ncbi:MAG: hypothetical protein Q4B84_03790 [Clostridia bacterium]|nr:hypothetical protein [Clostridia bacterium]
MIILPLSETTFSATFSIVFSVLLITSGAESFISSAAFIAPAVFIVLSKSFFDLSPSGFFGGSGGGGG